MRLTEEAICDFAFHAMLLPVLEAAVRVGLFDALSEPGTPAELRRLTGITNAGGLERMLSVLVSAGLAHKLDDGRYRCSELSHGCLRSSPIPSVVDYVMAMAEASRTLFGGYVADLREPSEPLLPAWTDDDGRESARRHSAAMVAATSPEVLEEVCSALLRHASPDSVRRILDLGSGVGVYGLAMARAFPQARVSLFDRDLVLELTRRYVEGRSGARRLDLITGDLLRTDYPSGCDLVFASHSLHCELDELDLILLKVAACLLPGGVLAIRYFERRTDGSDHPMSVLLGDLMNYTLYGKGQIHDRQVYERACVHAGLEVATHHDLPSSQVLVAVKSPVRGSGNTASGRS